MKTPELQEQFDAETTPKSFFRTRYRIVRDKHAGFEAQYKLWFWPFWLQCFFCNTSGTVEQARRIIEVHRVTVVEDDV